MGVIKYNKMIYPRTKLDLEIDAQKKRGILLVISGPSSGAGKDSVRNGFVKKYKVSKILTYTSRQKRPGERDGFDYNFISTKEFEKKIKEGFFLEWEKYLGNYYGSPKSEVKKKLNSGEDVLLRVDVRGAKSVKKAIPESVLVYIAAPSFGVMAKRLKHRRDNEEEIKRKLKVAVWEVEQFEGFDYLVVNEQGKLDQTIEIVKMILEAERHRVKSSKRR